MEEIFVGLGPEESANEEAIATLKRLKDVKLRITGDTVRLCEYDVKLPFIETESEQRFYGLNSIRKFVEKELQCNNHSR